LLKSVYTLQVSLDSDMITYILREDLQPCLESYKRNSTQHKEYLVYRQIF